MILPPTKTFLTWFKRYKGKILLNDGVDTGDPEYVMT